MIRIYEHEAQEAWFVRWEDPGMLEKLKAGISEKEYLQAYGNGFVITTPNHPFWVVDSDEELLRWEETHVHIGPPYPTQQWVRADHLAAGMRMSVADGRIVGVVSSTRVYKTNVTTTGWVPRDWSHGLLVDMSDQRVVPHVPLHEHRFRPGTGTYHRLVENPNDSYADDDPPGSAPQSWYRNKFYNLEVEEFHTYFVDTMGVWVHNGRSNEPVSRISR